MADPPIHAVLLDVGGTLWPESFRAINDREQLLTGRLADALPQLSTDLAVQLLKAFDARAGLITADLKQDTDSVVRGCARDVGIELSAAETVLARRALCVPVVGRIEPFPGTQELLSSLSDRGVTTIVVSNAITRDAATYLEDFKGFGLAGHIDGVISSVDVGFRKPHRAMFEAALAAVGCVPEECVMVGNSEVNDIEAARALGMRTIRVCIEEPVATTTAADAVVASLNELAAVLEAWWS